MGSSDAFEVELGGILGYPSKMATWGCGTFGDNENRRA